MYLVMIGCSASAIGYDCRHYKRETLSATEVLTFSAERPSNRSPLPLRSFALSFILGRRRRRGRRQVRGRGRRRPLRLRIQ